MILAKFIEMRLMDRPKILHGARKPLPYVFFGSVGVGHGNHFPIGF